MADFESIVAPHRSARRLPFAEKYQAAVDWAEIQVRAELPKPDDIIRKIKSNEIITDKDKGVIIAALSKKPKAMGRPTTPPGRNFWIRRLVLSVAREFELNPTRGEISPAMSAADAVADAMLRAKVFPNSYDRTRKLVAAAKPEENAIVKAHFKRQEAERKAIHKILLDLGMG